MSEKEEKDMIKADGTATPTVTVKVKKRGGCGTFLLGFIFAFVLMIVVVVGTGLYLYYNMSIQKVENLIGITIPVEGDIKGLALKDLFAKKDRLVNASLETLNTEFKLELPDTIPGTSLSLKETYEDEITFLGETKKVKEFRVQDIVNNLNDFVEAVLPKLYDHITIGQVVDTAGTTILTDLGYPALTDKFYNVGMDEAPNMKTLSELTINQALEKVPEYFSNDNLTVQMALDAIGADWLPKPEEGEEDIYAELRTLKINDISIENITSKITGEVLLKMVDLSGYDFLNTEEFKATKVDKLGDYIATLELGEFVELNTVVAGDTAAQNAYFNKSQYKNLDKTLKLAKVKETILGLKLNQIFDEVDLIKIGSKYSTTVTVEEFLSQIEGVTFATAVTDPTSGESAVDWSKYDGYVQLIKDATAADYATKINEANIQDLLGGADYITPVAKIAGLTISAIKDSDNAVDTLLAEFGTLGDMVGDNAGGIFDIIKEVTIQDLLDRPADAINEKLKASTETLETLLGAVPADANEIIKTVMSIEIGNLFTNGSSAITDAISTKTLGQMMNLSGAKGFVSLLANVSLGDLMGNSAVNAIKNALTTKTVDGTTTDVTLGEFLEIDTASANGILAKMAGISMAQLLGNATTTANPSGAIQGVVDSLMLKDVFGEYKESMSAILKELYAMETTDGQGSMLINDVFTKINDIKLSTVIGKNKPKIFDLISNYGDLTLGTVGQMTIKENLIIQDLIDAGLVVLEEGYELDEDVKAMKVSDAIKEFDKLYKAKKAAEAASGS